ncbi:hypothetical protein [Caballeronia sp. LZ031]|uniref:hypothetical protein n=1 Tax=Caballeronia sp. LZ031 TaxID=3038556 RepID=UPI00286552FD|nr:hypothetical protein [Caballeronia sp. LZ031]MDR5842598.1 hypothetical protein [Caballeronia sp. LZ031]
MHELDPLAGAWPAPFGCADEPESWRQRLSTEDELDKSGAAAEFQLKLSAKAVN